MNSNRESHVSIEGLKNCLPGIRCGLAAAVVPRRTRSPAPVLLAGDDRTASNAAAPPPHLGAVCARRKSSWRRSGRKRRVLRNSRTRG